MDSSNQNPLALQWSTYPLAHGDRRNLIIHVLTVPIFMAGSLLPLTSLWLGLWALPVGLAAMLFAIAAQGGGHKREHNPPAAFRGPRDALVRILMEQWITFPRFVLSGGLRRALRA